MTERKPVTFKMDEEDVERLDDIIWELEKQGDLPRRTNRSEVIRDLVYEWMEEQEGNSTPGTEKPMVAAD